MIGGRHRVARRFVAVGWKALVGEVEAEKLELQEKLADVLSKLKPDDR